MGFMHAFFPHSHHGHHGHHGRHHHRPHAWHGRGPDAHPGFAAQADAAERLERLAAKVARRLDLNEPQRQRFATLLAKLDAQRSALRPDGLLQALREPMAGPQLDRAALQSLLDARLAAVQQALPELISALGDFHDALDAEQQQVLRFLMRLAVRGRGGEARPDAASASEAPPQ